MMVYGASFKFEVKEATPAQSARFRVYGVHRWATFTEGILGEGEIIDQVKRTKNFGSRPVFLSASAAYADISEGGIYTPDTKVVCRRSPKQGQLVTPSHRDPSSVIHTTLGELVEPLKRQDRAFVVNANGQEFNPRADYGFLNPVLVELHLLGRISGDLVERINATW